MRVLFLYCDHFGLETHRKTSPGAPDDERRVSLEDAVVCLVHCEPGDAGAQVTKLIKNAKWIAGKFEAKRIVLHFFSHLAEEAGDPETALLLLQSAQKRLLDAGYEAPLMPFGWFCRLDLAIHGESLAKVFKVF